MGIEGIHAPRVDVLVAEYRQRCAAAIEEDMRARYELGRALLEVRQGESRGEHALEAVARALGHHLTLLARYRRVASVIPPKQFEAYVGMRDQYGKPLSWSHVERLAEVRSAKARDALAARIIAEELSVRDVKANIRDAARSGPSLR